MSKMSMLKQSVLVLAGCILFASPCVRPAWAASEAPPVAGVQEARKKAAEEERRKKEDAERKAQLDKNADAAKFAPATPKTASAAPRKQPQNTKRAVTEAGEQAVAETATPEKSSARNITPEKLQRAEKLLHEAMDELLLKAKRAFERNAWAEAAGLYDQALALAADCLPEVREKMAESLGQVERLRDLARINASLDAADAAAVRKDWPTVVRQKTDAINIIKNNFAQDEEFVTLKKQIQDQINFHKRELSARERTADLEAHGIDYLLKTFTNYKKQHLRQPRARLLRSEGFLQVYELSVVDKSQGRPSRLTFHFAYDERTKKWERVLP